MNLLIQHGATNFDSTLLYAVKRNNLSLIEHCVELGAENLKRAVDNSLIASEKNIDIIEYAIRMGEFSPQEIVSTALKYGNSYIIIELMKRDYFSLGEMNDLLIDCVEIDDSELDRLKTIIAMKRELIDEESLLFNLPQTILEGVMTERTAFEQK